MRLARIASALLVFLSSVAGCRGFEPYQKRDWVVPDSVSCLAGTQALERTVEGSLSFESGNGGREEYRYLLEQNGEDLSVAVLGVFGNRVLSIDQRGQFVHASALRGEPICGSLEDLLSALRVSSCISQNRSSLALLQREPAFAGFQRILRINEGEFTYVFRDLNGGVNLSLSWIARD